MLNDIIIMNFANNPSLFSVVMLNVVMPSVVAPKKCLGKSNN
jgi:hypothetical protein